MLNSPFPCPPSRYGPHRAGTGILVMGSGRFFRAHETRRSFANVCDGTTSNLRTSGLITTSLSSRTWRTSSGAPSTRRDASLATNSQRIQVQAVVGSTSGKTCEPMCGYSGGQCRTQTF